LANLVKIELIKNGYDEEIISEMVSMNIAWKEVNVWWKKY
jgi:hypothetical protein